MDALRTGQQAESEACDFLEKRGLNLLVRNYRCGLGEIDLIMQDQNSIVFVEVRVRNNLHYADPFESVDIRKQQKLIKTATNYLSHTHSWDKVDCRFDIIGISYAQSKAQIEWIKDAFSVDHF